MVKINSAAGLENPLQQVFPRPIVSTRAPTSNDKNYALGQIWVDKENDNFYGLVSVTAGAATWNLLATSTGVLDTLTGDSGGAVSPNAGNITLAGTANQIVSTGDDPSATITFSLADALDVVTSLTVPLIIGDDSGSLNIRLGDAGGADTVNILDSGSVTVATIDSDGNAVFTGLTSAGTTSLNASVNSNTVINSGTSTGTVTIGNGAAGAITVDSGAGISVDAAAASNFTVTGAAADLTLASAGGSVNVTASEAAADAIVVTASDAAGGIDVNAGSGGIAVDSTGAVSLDGAAASNFSVTGAGIDLTLASAAGRVVVNGEEAAADAVRILSAAGGLDADVALQMSLVSSQAAAADSVRIQASAADGGIDVDAGTGGITVDSTGAVSIDAATASNFTSSLASSAAAITISASAADSGITLDAGATPGVTFTNGTQSHQMLVGTGSPNGSVTASQGSLYVDVAGATSTTILFVNTDGGTTWVGVGA